MPEPEEKPKDQPNTPPPADPPKADPPAEEARIPKSRLDAEIAKTRAAEAKAAALEQAQAEREAAEREAAEAKAVEDGKLKEVIEAKERRIAELAPKAKLGDSLVDFVNQTIDDETANWPELARVSDPGAKALADRMAWVAKTRPLVAKAAEEAAAAATTEKPKPQGTGAKPSPATAPADPAQAKAATEKLVASQRVYPM